MWIDLIYGLHMLCHAILKSSSISEVRHTNSRQLSILFFWYRKNVHHKCEWICVERATLKLNCIRIQRRADERSFWTWFVAIWSHSLHIPAPTGINLFIGNWKRLTIRDRGPYHLARCPHMHIQLMGTQMPSKWMNQNVCHTIEMNEI